MKALKFFGTLAGIAAGTALTWWLIDASYAPAWALMFVLAVCITVRYVGHAIQSDLARIHCQLTGHSPARFKKGDEMGRCPECNAIIAIRAIESDGPGIDCGETLHQRIARIEAALQRVRLGPEENAE